MIRAQRKKAGIRQYALAMTLGRQEKAGGVWISNIERGVKGVSRKLWNQIFAIIGELPLDNVGKVCDTSLGAGRLGNGNGN